MHLEHAAVAIGHAAGPSHLVIVQPGQVPHGVQGAHRHGADRPRVEGGPLHGGSLPLPAETGHRRPSGAATATHAVPADAPCMVGAASLVREADAALVREANASATAFDPALAVGVDAAEGDGAGSGICSGIFMQGRSCTCRRAMARVGSIYTSIIQPADYFLRGNSASANGSWHVWAPL